MQENWIGKSEGVRFAFTHDIRGGDGALIGGGRLYVFTTRADTIMGVTFCAVAPEHPLAAARRGDEPRARRLHRALQDRRHDRGRTRDAATRKACDTGLFVKHPLSDEAIQLWVGNYVLMGYGDGAVMGVPAHDERDFVFAKKYGLAHAAGGRTSTASTSPTTAGRTGMPTSSAASRINSDVYSGLAYKAAVDAVAAALEHRGLGEKKTTWRLRDWGVSRQRYWGTPIPIIHCAALGAVPVPEKDLPVVLPEDLIPDGCGNPLNKHAAFLDVACPTCGRPGAARDRHDGHLRRLRLVLHALLRPGARRGDGRRRHAATGCRWTSTSAASSTRSCTCCTRASGPR